MCGDAKNEVLLADAGEIGAIVAALGVGVLGLQTDAGKRWDLVPANFVQIRPHAIEKQGKTKYDT